jgi:hypothetical protein
VIPREADWKKPGPLVNDGFNSVRFRQLPSGWKILHRPWREIREILLDESENGQRLRQNDPFCGILTPQERWAIYRAFHEENRP